MKKYYYKSYVITRLSYPLKDQYNCKYLITLNRDIVGFANTLKEVKGVINCD